jgi:hypothetical protein
MSPSASRRLGFTGSRSGDSADAGAGDDFGGFLFTGDEEGIEAFLAERDEFGRLLVELFPDRAVERACSFQSFDAAKFQGGVERGEIAKFHCHRAGGAADAFRQIDDDRLALVELAEAEFVIEIENDEELIPCPAVSGCHGGKLLVPWHRMEVENCA